MLGKKVKSSMKAGITEVMRKIVRKRFCQEVKGLELEEKGVE